MVLDFAGYKQTGAAQIIGIRIESGGDGSLGRIRIYSGGDPNLGRS
jgi:hypothetical protein